MKSRQMGKEDRRRLMLRFLAERDVALPPKVLYNNLRLYETITFGDETVQRHLTESEELGLVEGLDLGYTYYRITDRGRAYATGKIEFEDLIDEIEE